MLFLIHLLYLFLQLTVLPHIKLDTERDGAIGIARTVAVAAGCIVKAIAASTTPAHARVSNTAIRVTRVLCAPFPTVTE